jgi:hypothetical protein
MIVMRLALLLDRDPVTVSFQSVYRCLHHPEVVEELIRLMREDPFQSERIEEDIRHYTDESHLSNYRLGASRQIAASPQSRFGTSRVRYADEKYHTRGASSARSIGQGPSGVSLTIHAERAPNPPGPN